MGRDEWKTSELSHRTGEQPYVKRLFYLLFRSRNGTLLFLLRSIVFWGSMPYLSLTTGSSVHRIAVEWPRPWLGSQINIFAKKENMVQWYGTEHTILNSPPSITLFGGKRVGSYSLPLLILLVLTLKGSLWGDTSMVYNKFSCNLHIVVSLSFLLEKGLLAMLLKECHCPGQNFRYKHRKRASNRFHS